MQSTAALHPDLETLKKYSDGRLNIADSSVEEHLHSCETCCRRLGQIADTGDGLLARLRAAVGDEGAEGFSVLPRRLGRFRLERVLGEGSFGTVFEAYDEQLHRYIALKTPRLGSLPTAEMRERFLQEARIAASLAHENILPVYEAGEAAGTCFIASALCRGPNLAIWLHDRPQSVPPSVAAAIVAQLCQGLQHAHAKSVLHRDIKPSNVLLEPVELPIHGGVGGAATLQRRLDFPYIPRIADFGLARFLLGDGQTTRSSTLIGTVAYMSPEQARGRHRVIGPASDIYSLGAMLYELLTGRTPFTGETELDVLQQLPTQEPIRPCQLRPRIPLDLETICLKCLEKDPADRYASAAELSADLCRFLDGQPIHARPIGRVESAIRLCRRYPARASLVATVVIAALAIAGVSTAFTYRLQAEVRRVSEAERKGKEHLWESQLATISGRRYSGLSGQRLDGLDVVRDAVALERELRLGEAARTELRDEAVGCLALNDIRIAEHHGVFAPNGDPRRIAVDGRLQTAALLEQDGTASLVRLSDVRERIVLGRISESDDRIGMSQDGRNVAAISRHGTRAKVVVWTIAGKAATERSIECRDPVSFAFSHSSDRIIVVSAGGQIDLFEIAELQHVGRLASKPSPQGCCLDPAGRQLAVWADDTIRVFDVKSHELTRTLVHPGNDKVQAVAFSPDGGWIASGGSHHLAYVWSPGAEKPSRSLRGHQNWVTGVAFSPDGSTAITSSSDGTIRVWEYWTGRELVRTLGSGLRFDREGRRLAAIVGSELRTFEVTGGLRTTARSETPMYEAHGCEISPDGRLAVSWSYDGVRIWNCQSATEIGHINPGFSHWATILARGSALSVLAGTFSGVSETAIELSEDLRSIAAGPSKPLPLPPEVNCFAHGVVSADGGTLCLVSEQNEAYVARLDAPETVVTLRGDHIGRIALSPDGHTLAAYRTGKPGVTLWKSHGRTIAGRLLPDQSVSSAIFSPDGASLVVDTRRHVISIDLDSGRELVRIPLADADAPPTWGSDMSFTASCSLLAVSRPGYEIKLIAWPRKVPLAVLPADVPSPAARLSPDGKRLVCRGAQQTLQVWNLEAIGAQLVDIGL